MSNSETGKRRIAYNPRVFDDQDNSDAQPWFGDGLSFACTQCGNCCTGPSGYVWFSEEEAQAMADYLGTDFRSFHQRYARRAQGRWTLEEVRNGRGYDCVFLRHTEEGKRVCSIYPVRPTQCRTWPFWPSNVRSRGDWEASSKTCPGMRAPDARGEHFVPIEKIRIIMAENPEHL